MQSCWLCTHNPKNAFHMTTALLVLGTGKTPGIRGRPGVLHGDAACQLGSPYSLPTPVVLGPVSCWHPFYNIVSMGHSATEFSGLVWAPGRMNSNALI